MSELILLQDTAIVMAANAAIMVLCQRRPQLQRFSSHTNRFSAALRSLLPFDMILDVMKPQQKPVL